jgi:hypothetical protein
LAAIEGVKIVPAGWVLSAAIKDWLIGTLLLPDRFMFDKGISCVPITSWVGFVKLSVRDSIDIRYTIIKYFFWFFY